MAAPKYKLTFFPTRARSEIPRLVFAAAKVDFEFVQIDHDTEWSALKGDTPYGGLPVLEIDGEKHGQGMAISNYLASEFGLAGSSNMDRFLIDQIHNLREDLITHYEAPHFLERDPDAKAAKTKELEEEVYPRFMALFWKALKKNNGGTGFFIGSKLSLGDLILFGALTTALKTCPKVFEKFPELIAHRARIAEIDGIKQYLAALPDTPI